MQNKPNLYWERLQKVIQSTGMSVNAFALHIGLARSENLYQIKKGNHGISKSLAQLIHSHYPNYTVGWLLTGESQVLYNEFPEKLEVKDRVIRNIPVYYRFNRKTKPMDYIYISDDYVNGAEIAVINKDESLAPKIPVGAMVFVKPATMIIAGHLYLVATEGFSVIRKVTVQHDDVYLSSVDRDNYADFSMKRSQIVAFYSVEKVLTD